MKCKVLYAVLFCFVSLTVIGCESQESKKADLPRKNWTHPLASFFSLNCPERKEQVNATIISTKHYMYSTTRRLSANSIEMGGIKGDQPDPTGRDKRPENLLS